MLRLVQATSHILERTFLNNNVPQTARIRNVCLRNFTSLLSGPSVSSFGQTSSLLRCPADSIQHETCNKIISRNVTKFSMQKGKRKSVSNVMMRFYRLAWGGWIRTMCGRQKKLWKKTSARKRRLRQHVLCNATQSTLLDKMAGPFWTRRRYYVDDPYEPYHEREYFPLSSTKPKPFIPPNGKVPNC